MFFLIRPIQHKSLPIAAVDFLKLADPSVGPFKIWLRKQSLPKTNYKKNKHLEACLEQRKDFTPLVYSVDGIAAREAKAAKRHHDSALAWKWKLQYSEMCGFVREYSAPSRQQGAAVSSTPRHNRWCRHGRMVPIW
jgi:hypothetical protein